MAAVHIGIVRAAGGAAKAPSYSPLMDPVEMAGDFD